MNLFLFVRGAVDADAAAEALGSVAADLPYLDGASLRTWRAPSERATLVWMAHPPERVGGVEYVRARERAVSLFAGRPLGSLEDWDALEGRCTAARYDDDTGALEVFSDPLGAYPVFIARSAVSNSPEVLRRLFRTTAIDPGAVASLVAGGWPLSGHPIWADVRRVPRGAVLRLDGSEHVRELLPAGAIADWFAPRELDAEAAADAIVATLRGLAEWPGRPDLVATTGGRDARVVLAAACRAGFDFRAVTIGGDGDPDVELARVLCERMGVAHERLPEPPGGVPDHHRAAERTAIIGGGAAAAEAPGGIPRDAVPGPLVLWHSGQGGEIGRAIYGAAPPGGPAAVVDQLYRAFAARRPGRPELLSAEGEQMVRAELDAWSGELLAAGLSVADLPDAFYLLQRMSHWAAMGHSVVEWIRDTTSPLWSTRVIPHMLALPLEQRARDGFHLEVLRVLAPELVDVPFADGTGWATAESRWRLRRRRAARLAARASAEARRRLDWARAARTAPPPAAVPPPAAGPARALSDPPPAGADPLVTLMADVREWVRAAPDHPALAVVDRERALPLLERPPITLDFVRHAQVMRLATIVMAIELAGG